MAFVPVPNTVMVEIIYEYDTQVVENTMYFEFDTGAPTASDITDLLQAIRQVVISDLIPLLTSAIQIVRLVGTLLDAIDSIQITELVSPPVAGGSASEAMPNNVTYAIKFVTALRGRSFRGRNFIPGIPSAGVDGNSINPTFRQQLLDYFVELQTAIDTIGWSWVVVSRISNGVERVTGVTTPVLTADTADSFMDSQRRRLPGRGT